MASLSSPALLAEHPLFSLGRLCAIWALIRCRTNLARKQPFDTRFASLFPISLGGTFVALSKSLGYLLRSGTYLHEAAISVCLVNAVHLAPSISHRLYRMAEISPVLLSLPSGLCLFPGSDRKIISSHERKWILTSWTR